MTNLIKKKPVLLAIDIQKGFYDEGYWGGNISNKNIESISSNLINKIREKIYTKNSNITKILS